MTTRDALLDVTARLYAEHGWRGTTTRRIADAAGMNEVTIFRHFGSKEALLLEAIRKASVDANGWALPEAPGDLRAELEGWALAQHAALSERRGIIRSCMAEWGERPEMVAVACEGGMQGFLDVVRYLAVARDRGLIGTDGSLEAATVMLMNGIFMDAMTRDVMPGVHPHSPEEATALFVDLVLRALRPEGACAKR